MSSCSKYDSCTYLRRNYVCFTKRYVLDLPVCISFCSCPPFYLVICDLCPISCGSGQTGGRGFGFISHSDKNTIITTGMHTHDNVILHLPNLTITIIYPFQRISRLQTESRKI